MLKEKDKIFKNLYGFQDWNLKGAQYRGIWKETKDLISPLSKKSSIHDDNVTNLLNYYELINELKTIHG